LWQERGIDPAMWNVELVKTYSPALRRDTISERASTAARHRKKVKDQAVQRRDSLISARRVRTEVREAQRVQYLVHMAVVASQKLWLKLFCCGVFTDKLAKDMLRLKEEAKLVKVRSKAAVVIQTIWRRHCFKEQLKMEERCGDTVRLFASKLLMKMRSRKVSVVLVFLRETKGLAYRRRMIQSFRKRVKKIQEAYRAYKSTWLNRRQLLHLQWNREEPAVLEQMRRQKKAREQAMNKLAAKQSKQQTSAMDEIKEMGIQVSDDMRQALIEGLHQQLRDGYLRSVQQWEEESAAFKKKFMATAQAEMAKMMMRGKLPDGTSLPQFCRMHMDELYAQRPPKPIYPFMIPAEEMQELIRKGSRLQEKNSKERTRRDGEKESNPKLSRRGSTQSISFERGTNF